MDRWIISELNKLIKQVDKYLSKYVSPEPARLIVDFVDELSNWYVRRSRERFWVSGETEDKTAAFTTLYYCLTNLTKLCAPFVPIITEQIYQNIVRSVDKSAPISVHLCDYPVADESLIDNKLNNGMNKVKNIVVLGRACRNSSNIKNRQPLRKIVVVANKNIRLKAELVDLIKDELNVLEVKFATDATEFVDYEIKPQLKTLGPKYGKLLAKIREHLQTSNGKVIVDTVETGKPYCFDADGTTVELYKDDLLISHKSKDGYISETDGQYSVILDTELDEELVNMGLVREFVSKVQQTRKDSKFEITDHIIISVYADDQTNKILLNNSRSICKDTLADKFLIEKVDGQTETIINDKKLLLSIKKA